MKRSSDSNWIIATVILFMLLIASGATSESEVKPTSEPEKEVTSEYEEEATGELEQLTKTEEVSKSTESVNDVLGTVPYSEEWFFNILNSVEIGSHSNIDVYLEQDGENLLTVDMNSKKSVSSVATIVHQKVVENNTNETLLKVIGTGISDTPIGQVCKLRFTIPAEVSKYQENNLSSNYSKEAYSEEWFFDILSGVEIGSHSNINVYLKDSTEKEILLIKMDLAESVPGVATLVYQKATEYSEEELLLDVIGTGISDTPLGHVHKLQLTIPKR